MLMNLYFIQSIEAPLWIKFDWTLLLKLCSQIIESNPLDQDSFSEQTSMAVQDLLIHRQDTHTLISQAKKQLIFSQLPFYVECWSQVERLINVLKSQVHSQYTSRKLLRWVLRIFLFKQQLKIRQIFFSIHGQLFLIQLHLIFDSGKRTITSQMHLFTKN